MTTKLTTKRFLNMEYAVKSNQIVYRFKRSKIKSEAFLQIETKELNRYLLKEDQHRFW